MATVFEVLVTSSVMILGILCLRKLTMGKISMRVRYAFWLLVAVRLLLPVSLGTSSVSVMNLISGGLQEGGLSRSTTLGIDGQVLQEEASLFENGQAANDAGEPRSPYGGQFQTGLGEIAAVGQHLLGEEIGQIDNAATGIGEEHAQEAVMAGEGGKNVSSETLFSIRTVVMLLWMIGFLAVGGYQLISQLRFIRYLRQNRREISVDALSGEWKKRLENRGMKVYQVQGLPSPCLVGGHIYIGERGIFEPKSLSHVLAHEYCHALHLDGFWAFLRCLLVAVYWFDPFVWAAAFAARQDSDLACDEAAVRLLGEEERFAYGRTLLALLQESGGRAECPGMPLMFSGDERSVRERVVALAERNKTEAVVLVAVLSMVCLICGCAFTGAQEDEAGNTVSEEIGEPEAGENVQDAMESVNRRNEELVSEMDRLWVLENELNKEFAQIQAEYEALDAAKQAAFEEVLNYHGVMEGKDDSELFLNRQVDQHFIEYGAAAREATDMVIQDAPEEGWYLLCRGAGDSVSLYGLFTKDFGCRGMKTLIGEDVNTFDLVWYPTGMNGDSGNIRVLERAADGLPRRFVFQYMEEESAETEIWRLASGFRYDTGTVDLEVLPEEDYLSWADWHLTYQIDEEREQVRVFYDKDGSGMTGILDISDYAGLPIEEVCVAPDTVGFDLDSEAFEGEENIALKLCIGLKLAGYEDVFIDGLSPLSVQVLFNEDEDGEFRFGQPKVDERYQIHCLAQERKLEEIKSRTEGK